MPWDSVEVGLAGGEETVNFGPRKESGSSLYQVDTLASVSPRGEVCWFPHVNLISLTRYFFAWFTYIRSRRRALNFRSLLKFEIRDPPLRLKSWLFYC